MFLVITFMMNQRKMMRSRFASFLSPLLNKKLLTGRICGPFYFRQFYLLGLFAGFIRWFYFRQFCLASFDFVGQF